MLEKLILNKYLILGVVAALALSYHFWTVSSLEKSLSEMTSSYEKISIASQLQNEEIARWQALGTQYGTLLADASKRNAEESKRWAGLYEKIRQDNIPADCEGAMTHLHQTTNEIAKEWNKK